MGHTQIESLSKSLLELQFDWIFCNLVSATKKYSCMGNAWSREGIGCRRRRWEANLVSSTDLFELLFSSRLLVDIRMILPHTHTHTHTHTQTHKMTKLWNWGSRKISKLSFFVSTKTHNNTHHLTVIHSFTLRASFLYALLISCLLADLETPNAA